MGDFGWHLSDLLFKLKLKQERIDALESGEEYVRMREQLRQELAYQNKIIKDLQRTIAEKDRQITENRKNWEQVYDDIMEECRKEIAEKDRIIAVKDQKILELEQALSAEKAKSNESKKEMYAAQTDLADAREQIAALQAKLNKDFTNSSKPSSQTPDHKTIHNGRTKSGRKPGGQPGHPHHGRKKLEDACEVRLPAPRKVLENPSRYELTGKEFRKQLISAKLVVTATEFVAQEYLDILTGDTFHADFPVGIADDVEFDSRVKAMAYMLNNECDVSIGKTRQLLFDLSNGKLDISTGAISNFTKEFSEKSKEEREEIKQQLLASDVLHADYTFGRKQGKMSTVLIMANENSVAYDSVSAKGNAGVKETELDTYNGIMVSDHEAAFVGLGCKRQECMVHTGRYGKASVENEPKLTWNRRFVDWDQRAIKHWHSYDPNSSELWETKSEALIQEFNTILQIAKAEYEYEPPSKYYMDGFNLYKRMAEAPDDYILFLRDPSVPPSNNRAEVCARRYKRKAHQVMTFRGKHGEEHYCSGLTIIETAKKQGRNVYDEVTGYFDTIVVRQKKRTPVLTTLDKMKKYSSDPESTRLVPLT